MADGDLVYIDVKEFTDNVTTNTEFEVTGTGIFDALMDTATKHLTAQLEAGRLRGEDYATAYIQVYTVTLQAALQAWLQKGIAEKQLELLEAQVDSEDAKKNLYVRQIEGLDEDFLHKISKLGLDGWSVALTVAQDAITAEGFPAFLQATTLNDIFNQYVKPNLDRYKYDRPDAIS